MNKEANKQMEITGAQWSYPGALEKLLDLSTGLSILTVIKS